MHELAAHVQAWTTSIVSLARRIEDFRQNKLICKDLKEVPKSIATLEERLDRESDPMMVAELERTLASRRQQLAMLEKLQQNTQMAEVKIENTLPNWQGSTQTLGRKGQPNIANPLLGFAVWMGVLLGEVP